MKEFEFILKFSLPDNGENPEHFLDRLVRAGCDDALVGIGCSGRIVLDFSRQAPSAREAILSAVRDVKQAIPDARLTEAAPDLVGLTDVADILGFSRQNMRKLMLKNPNFPPPFHEGKPSVWHLAGILQWMQKKNRYPIDQSLLEIAVTNMQLNIVRELPNLEAALQDDLQILLA